MKFAKKTREGLTERRDILLAQFGHAVDTALFDRIIAVNLRGTFLVCRHVIPRIIAAGGGSIVNSSSVVALQGQPIHVYSAAKGGVLSLTRALAATYGKQRVRVNAICPGMVMSERIKVSCSRPWADVCSRAMESSHCSRLFSAGGITRWCRGFSPECGRQKPVGMR